MNPAQIDALRDAATDAVDVYPGGQVRILADGVLALLDERENGRRLAEERFDSEIAELRDELLAFSRTVPSLAAHDALRSEIAATQLDVTMLQSRVDGVARRADDVERLAGATSGLLEITRSTIMKLGGDIETLRLDVASACRRRRAR